MSEHSRLSPSGMSRILKCPGSAVDNPPDRGSEAADLGTLAHSFGEAILSPDGGDVKFPDDEMKSAVFDYVGYVRAHKSHDELEGVDHTNSKMLMEERIVSETLPDYGGTIDTLIVSDTHLHVIDFKYGQMLVPPRDNKQIQSYLDLASEKYPGRQRFFGTIVQPRVSRNYSCIEYAADQLLDHRFQVTLACDDTTRTAGDHCQWCPLKQGCDVVKAHLLKVAQMDFDDDWTGVQCTEVIAMAGVVTQMVKEAKTRLTKLLLDGETVEGWKLVRQLGNRCWRDEEKVVADLLARGIKEEFIFNQKIKSPSQMEKSFVPTVHQVVVGTHAHRPDKGVAAAEASSTLPDYDPTEAFDKLEVAV